MTKRVIVLPLSRLLTDSLVAPQVLLLLFLLPLSCLLTANLFAQQSISPASLSKTKNDTIANTPVRAQKAEIDTAVLNHWPSVGPLTISDDGQYVIYGQKNVPPGSHVLVLQATEGTWRKELPGAERGVFAGGDHYALVPAGDSLCVLKLGTEERTYIREVHDYKPVQRKGSSWVLCLTGTGSNQALVWEELATGKQKCYQGVLDYQLSDDTTRLVWTALEVKGNDTSYTVREELLEDGGVQEICRSPAKAPAGLWLNGTGSVVLYSLQQGQALSLHWYEAAEKRDRTIWSGAAVQGCRFDPAGRQLVFMTGEGIMYYQTGQEKAIAKITDRTAGMDEALKINARYAPGFTADGRHIFFRLTAKVAENGCAPTDGTGVQVDVWHYRDQQLQSVQLAGNLRLPPKSYLAVLEVDQARVVRIEEEGESGQAQQIEKAREYVLLKKGGGDEAWWPPEQQAAVAVAVVALSDGRHLLHRRLAYDPGNLMYQLSPGERYLLYYDPSGKQYRSYELATGHERILTKDLAVSWEDESLRFRRWPDPVSGSDWTHYPMGLCGWVDGDRRVLVYSARGLWSLDPAGIDRPRNLTQGADVHSPVRFWLVARADGAGQAWGDCMDLSGKEDILLQGVNEATREVTVYRRTLKEGGQLVPLLQGGYASGSSLFVLKAAHAPRWVVMRSSEQQAPNWLVTDDFKTFRPLSNIAPEKAYRWYRTELVSWTLPNGERCQGALFKPEDMDSTRKYPVLFNYYELRAGTVHNYYKPEWLKASDVNIPYFVSRGYLVFMPDIHPRIGHPGQSALEAVESAARWLMKRPYVDGSHMAVMGHSYGAFETNYIITRSHLFAAAAESAGMADVISDYGTITETGGNSRQELYEISQSRIGATLWQRPDLYRENSPVLAADKITTPLLMLHNKQDDHVPWQQGVELFTALRRLGRPVWLLQYDGETHSLRKENNLRDYTIRLTQFLDHYLKGAPAPVWMTRGIAARCKGQQTGYEIKDSTIKH